MKEYVLSLDDFGIPKTLSKVDAEYTNIIRLILLNPGTFQSHPTMGVGLKQRYRFKNTNDFMVNLKNDIRDQLNEFLPQLAVTDVELSLKNNTLDIIIDTENGAYALVYDEHNNVLSASAKVLSDL